MVRKILEEAVCKLNQMNAEDIQKERVDPKMIADIANEIAALNRVYNEHQKRKC